MGYERQTFENDKTILQAEHLIHIEDGIVMLESKIESAYLEDTALIQTSDYIVGKYIKEGVIIGGGTDYRLGKFELKNSAKVQIITNYAITRTDIPFTFLAKYTDDSYTTLDKIILQTPADRSINDIFLLETGFYAVCWNNTKYYGTSTPNKVDDDEIIIIAKGRDSVDNNNNQTSTNSKSACFANINNYDLLLQGSANIDEDGIITVGGGSSNRATYGDFQASHFSMSAKIKVSSGSDFSFVMGKDGSSYGYYIDLSTSNETSTLKIYKDQVGDFTTPKEEKTLDFQLKNDEIYLIRLTFDIETETQTPSKVMKIEIFNENNDYFTHSTTCNGYGKPFFYSHSNECKVYEYNLSIQHYYDIRNAKIAVFGHSFVEGDSLGANRGKAFAYLLEKEIGEKKVINFGLGGDSLSAMHSKIKGAKKFVQNCEYALMCIGTNDRGLTSDVFITRLESSIKEIENMGITPILFTVPHGNYVMSEAMYAENDWIRNSGYYFVDMYKVFANADGTCKTDLFLADKIHPTIEGHQFIVNRIKMDCPFLF